MTKRKKDSQGLQDFVELCKHLSPEQIYYVFNARVMKEEIRDEVYDSYAKKRDIEPCRAAMIRMGEKYNVQSLKDY